MPENTAVPTSRVVAHLGHKETVDVDRDDITRSVHPDNYIVDMVTVEPDGMFTNSELREIEEMGWGVEAFADGVVIFGTDI